MSHTATEETELMLLGLVFYGLGRKGFHLLWFKGLRGLLVLYLVELPLSPLNTLQEPALYWYLLSKIKANWCWPPPRNWWIMQPSDILGLPAFLACKCWHGWDPETTIYEQKWVTSYSGSVKALSYGCSEAILHFKKCLRMLTTVHRKTVQYLVAFWCYARSH